MKMISEMHQIADNSEQFWETPMEELPLPYLLKL